MNDAPAISPDRTASRAIYVGLALTIVASVVPFIDRSAWHVLSGHIRSAYPAYGNGEVDTAATAYLTILSVLGGMGIICWLAVAGAVHAGKAWARWAATGILAVAVCIALAGLLTKDTSGGVGLAPLLAWLQVMPCLAGVVAVASLWKSSR